MVLVLLRKRKENNKEIIKWSYKWANIHMEGRFIYKCRYTFFLFAKMSLLFFYKQRYEMFRNRKGQNKCKVEILGAKIWLTCWRRGPRLCSLRGQLFKKY